MSTMIANEQSLQAQIEALKAANAALKAQVNGKLTLKVSEKGAVSVYGMGKWPVTLYRTQWERLIANVPQIEAFIAANSAQLTTK
jgi:hypothetical protein